MHFVGVGNMKLVSEKKTDNFLMQTYEHEKYMVVDGDSLREMTDAEKAEFDKVKENRRACLWQSMKPREK
jgi:hypothetical protein